MTESENTENNIANKEAILGISGKVNTHPIFCQCILPVRALPKDIKYYQVRHGNSSLIMQAGILIDEKGKPQEMEVPAGAKARILLSYITDHAKHTGNPTVDMGDSLRSFMMKNDISIGGSNSKEITRQARNIAASSINLGIWGETADHKKFSSQKNYRVAKEFSFWTEKNPEQLSIWNQYITLSEEFMTALESHSVYLNLQPFIELQANPRAMDMYAWLSYRISSVKTSIKISYKDLHAIFGQQTKAIGSFKQEFRRALELALPYVPEAELDMKSDMKHLIIRNNKNKIFIPAGGTSLIGENPIEEGVFGELLSIGLSNQKIKEIIIINKKEQIEKALLLTKQAMKKGKVKNPPGLFTKALKEDWKLVEETKNIQDPEIVSPPFDSDYEDKIDNEEWKTIRIRLRKKYGDSVFNNWIKQINFIEKGRGVVILSAPTPFIKEWCDKNYLDDLIKFWIESDKEIKDVTIKVKK